MTSFNPEYIQSGDGNVAEPIHVGRPGQQVVLSNEFGGVASNTIIDFNSILDIPSNFRGIARTLNDNLIYSAKDDGSLLLQSSSSTADNVAERIKKGTLLHGFNTLTGLTASGTNASISQQFDANTGLPVIRLIFASAGATTLDIDVPVQAFLGTNSDGTDADGIALMYYISNATGAMASLDVYIGSDPAFTAGTFKSVTCPIYDGKYFSTNPPVGGYNWIYLKKSDFTSGTLDLTDPTKLLTNVRLVAPAASAGYIYLESLFWNLQKPVNQALITFDLPYKSVITNAFPIMQSLGLKGSIYCVGSDIGGAGMCTLADLHTLYEAGWDIGTMGWSHLDATGYTTAEQVKTWMGDIQRGVGWQTEQGFTRGKEHFAYGFGKCIPGTHDVALAQAGFKTGRVTNSSGLNAQHHIGITNPHTIVTLKSWVQGVTVPADYIAQFDNADNLGVVGAQGRTSFMYFHEVSDVNTTINITIAEFTEVMTNLASRVINGTYQVKTLSQWSDYVGL